MTKKQRRTYKRISACLLAAAVLVLLGWYLAHANIAVLNPQGAVATKEFHLIVFGTILSMIIIVPVFIMTFMIVYRYRADRHTSRTAYTPDWDGNRKLETLWWGIPLVIIVILGVVTWQSSHALDPSTPIDASISDRQPLKVQVVSLQWKWLFIYPDQGVASVNLLRIPANTPVVFQITADSPMNSFWIPQLGGQVYAMSGMSTQLHLIANKTGEFRGVSANLSGDGFAGMDFTTQSVSDTEFANWVSDVKGSPYMLDSTTYDTLAKPSKNNSPTVYNVDGGASGASLYDTVVHKYMAPSASTGAGGANMDSMGGMDAMPQMGQPMDGMN